MKISLKKSLIKRNKNSKVVYRQLIRNLLFVASFCTLSSCGTTTYLSNGYGTKITTSVSSFGNYSVLGKTFYIESGDKNVSSSDVEFREYANYVATSLKCQGATETYDKKNADMCVLVNYGISDESYTETVPIPVWGQTGIASTRVNPTYGVTDYINVDRRVSMYCRVLNIYAYDNKRTSDATMLWKINLASCGNSSDMRNVLPYMAYAAWGNMGKSTGGNEEYTTFLDDYYFRCWKQGVLFNSNLIGFPQCTSTNADRTMQIAIVEKLSTETIVVFRKSGCPGWYSIAPTTYIEYNGQKYMVKSADGYELGKKIRNECGTRYLRLHFQAVPSSAKSINISEGTKNGWVWNGLSIK
jgi:hypothetical protein